MPPAALNVTTLAGEGVPANIDVGSTRLFVNTVVGQTSTTTANLTNRTSIALFVYSIDVTPSADSGDFGIVTDGCSGMTLAAHSSCPVTVSFTPSAQGLRTGSLTIASNAAGNPSATLPMQGTGTLSAPTHSPGSLAFGKVAEGGNSMLTVTFTNPNPVVPALHVLRRDQCERRLQRDERHVPRKDDCRQRDVRDHSDLRAQHRRYGHRNADRDRRRRNRHSDCQPDGDRHAFRADAFAGVAGVGKVAEGGNSMLTVTFTNPNLVGRPSRPPPRPVRAATTA